MNEFKKLTWRTDVNDSELDKEFLNDEAVASLHAYKSFANTIKPKKKVKLNLTNNRYIPGLKQYKPIKRRSFLTKAQKGQCLTAFKLTHSGKQQDLLSQQDKYVLNVYKECQSNIIKENALFNEFVRNLWLGNVSKKILKKIACPVVWTKWKEKLKRYLHYPQFYEKCGMISMNFDENEACVDFQHVVQPLETGTLARYAHSSLKEACTLSMNVIKQIADQPSVHSKSIISEDANIVKLLENYDIDVAISASALKQIIDFTNVNSNWIIPVLIKEEEIVKEDGVKMKKKIVFIDKVLPNSNPNIQDLKLHAYKRLLKLQFCQYEAFTYPVEEVQVETAPDENSDGNGDAAVKENKQQIIHHNANYRIWNIKKSFVQNTLMKNVVKDKDMNLLVRCKLDACEDTEQGCLVPVVIRPKIEQQIQYGANVATKSELSRDWTSLFFRLFSVLYRARIYSPQNEIISLEKCHIQKINSEAQTLYDHKPILGLGVLQKVLSFLIGLDCGNYILQHTPRHQSFLSVMKACNTSVQNAFDLHKQCENPTVDMKMNTNWIPIDVNYVLPAHEEHNTIPAMFEGFDLTTGKKKKKKKSNVKKNPVPE